MDKLMKLDIKCFQHCSRTERYLCFEIPDTCKSCSKSLNYKENGLTFRVPPFILPSPFVVLKKLASAPFSLLIQPTNGDYTKFVKLKSPLNREAADIGDLHIGITNSKMDVFDFDKNGLNKNAKRWFSIPSIAINLERLIEKDTFPFSKTSSETNKISTKAECDNQFKRYRTDNWDAVLESHWNNREKGWNPLDYDEFKNNCLDFIIRFLLDYGFFDQNYELCATKQGHANSILNSSRLKEQHELIIKSYFKQKLTREIIEPEFLKCFKYLNLLIQLHEFEFLIEKFEN